MSGHRAQPPDEVVDRVRAICATLPGAREHDAWTGTSWRIGSSTFVHVVQIDDGRPPAYATAFGTAGPATVVTFQAPPEDRDALRATGHPYHLPPWRPGIAGVVIERSTDWSELAERIEDSFRECGGDPDRTARADGSSVAERGNARERPLRPPRARSCS